MWCGSSRNNPSHRRFANGCRTFLSWGLNFPDEQPALVFRSAFDSCFILPFRFMPKRTDIHSVFIMEGCLNHALQGRDATELICQKLGLNGNSGNQSKLF